MKMVAKCSETGWSSKILEHAALLKQSLPSLEESQPYVRVDSFHPPDQTPEQTNEISQQAFRTVSNGNVL